MSHCELSSGGKGRPFHWADQGKLFGSCLTSARTNWISTVETERKDVRVRREHISKGTREDRETRKWESLSRTCYRERTMLGIKSGKNRLDPVQEDFKRYAGESLLGEQ